MYCLKHPVLRRSAQPGQKISGGHMETQSKTVVASISAILDSSGGGQRPTSAVPTSDDALWTADWI
jgi:hypothetical protein